MIVSYQQNVATPEWTTRHKKMPAETRYIYFLYRVCQKTFWPYIRQNIAKLSHGPQRRRQSSNKLIERIVIFFCLVKLIIIYAFKITRSYKPWTMDMKWAHLSCLFIFWLVQDLSPISPSSCPVHVWGELKARRCWCSGENTLIKPSVVYRGVK